VVASADYGCPTEPGSGGATFGRSRPHWRVAPGVGICERIAGHGCARAPMGLSRFALRLATDRQHARALASIAPYAIVSHDSGGFRRDPRDTLPRLLRPHRIHGALCHRTDVGVPHRGLPDQPPNPAAKSFGRGTTPAEPASSF